MRSRGSGNASLNLYLVALLSLLLLMADDASAATVTVSWTLGSQISPISLQAGSTLHFKYDSSIHNVYSVSSNDYYACGTSSPFATYYSGDDYITLSNRGSYYFLCATPGHCNGGMKVAVTVF